MSADEYFYGNGAKHFFELGKKQYFSISNFLQRELQCNLFLTTSPIAI